jgi:hypothetical protein
VSAVSRRGGGVIIELFVNHSSDQHPWLQALEFFHGTSALFARNPLLESSLKLSAGLRRILISVHVDGMLDRCL